MIVLSSDGRHYKWCNGKWGCHQLLPTSEYYARDYGDGLQPHCIACQRERVRQRRR